MRPLFCLISVSVALVAGVASAQPSGASQTAVPGDAVFVISGRGWGHGVGMSQYGAFGMANAGYTYDKILGHYYVGTQLGRVSSRDVRVLLADGRPAVTVSSASPFTVVDSTGSAVRLPAGALVVKPDLVIAAPAGPMAAVGPILVRPGKSALAFDGRQYRGRLQISLEGAYLEVVDVVALESYVQGVVAGEMPYTWPLEALKAQAVAARSYALASLVKGKSFDLYSDERSQVYPGVAGERTRANQATAATAGQVVLYGGRIARTLYFSSSGGKTASSADVYGVAVPYLVSQPDPWDTASPYEHWGPILLGARTLQTKLGANARVIDATGISTPSSRLRSLVLQTLVGSTTVPASLLRTALGLRSTWVTIGVLRLDKPPSSSAVYGSSLLLSGVARALPSSQLASSSNGVTWSPVGALNRSTSGAFSALVKPSETMRYRIEATQASSSALLVRVAPRVRLIAPAIVGELSGTVRPRLSGAAVTIERLQGAIWTPVASAVVDATGAFQAEFDVLPGSYRARVAPTEGYAEGIAPVLTVSG